MKSNLIALCLLTMSIVTSCNVNSETISQEDIFLNKRPNILFKDFGFENQKFKGRLTNKMKRIVSDTICLITLNDNNTCQIMLQVKSLDTLNLDSIKIGDITLKKYIRGTNQGSYFRKSHGYYYLNNSFECNYKENTSRDLLEILSDWINKVNGTKSESEKKRKALERLRGN